MVLRRVAKRKLLRRLWNARQVPIRTRGSDSYCQYFPGGAERWREEERERKLAGWEARTRPLAGPLSPRGPQPVPQKLRDGPAGLNGPPEPRNRVRGS